MALADKMANSIDTNKKLQQIYLPGQTAVVRLADEARDRGRVIMQGSKNEGVESRGKKMAKYLKTMARETGLEPAASAVTGRRSNQLSYSRGCRNQRLSAQE